MNLDEFFASRPGSRELFDAVWRQVQSLGPATLRVTKSQIAFVRRRPFAWVWVPAMYLRGDTAPLVLTFALRYRRPSGRWKEIYEAAPSRFTHHLEIWTLGEIDEEVHDWLDEAWQSA